MVNILENNKSRVQLHKYPSLKLNALSNWVILGVNIIIGLLLTPAIMAHLGEKRFGIWMLVSSLVGYFGLLQLGVGTGVFRYVPLYRGKGEKEKIGEIVSTGLTFYVVIGFLILTTSLLLAAPIANYFKGGRELAILIRLFGIAAALECPTHVLTSAIIGYEGFVIANAVRLLVAVIRALALFGCILMNYGLMAMGSVQLMVTVFGLIATSIIFAISCRNVEVGITKVNLSALKLLVLYGLVITIEGVGLLLTSHSPRLIIGKTVSLEAVGFFGIVCLLIIYYRKLLLSITKVFMPRFSYFSGQNANKEIRQLFLRGSRYVAIIAGGLGLLLWTVGPSFLCVWIKNDNIRQAIPALMILTIGTLVFVSHGLSIHLLYGLEKQKKLAIFSMIEGISVLVFSLILSYKYGMTGVAVGVSVPLVLIRGIVQVKYVCKLLKIGFWKYYTDCIFKPWIIAIVLAIASYYLGLANYANDWFFLFLVSGLIVLVYGAGVYTIAIETEEKRQIKDRFLAVLGYGYI